MTKITDDEVAHLASLGNLSLSDDEEASLKTDLEAILGYIKKLSELDTEGVEPTYQVTGLTNIFREDTVAASVGRDQLLALSPDTKDHAIKVPKVL